VPSSHRIQKLELDSFQQTERAKKTDLSRFFVVDVPLDVEDVVLLSITEAPRHPLATEATDFRSILYWSKKPDFPFALHTEEEAFSLTPGGINTEAHSLTSHVGFRAGTCPSLRRLVSRTILPRKT